MGEIDLDLLAIAKLFQLARRHLCTTFNSMTLVFAVLTSKGLRVFIQLNDSKYSFRRNNNIDFGGIQDFQMSNQGA
jgi:hypothetical protein